MTLTLPGVQIGVHIGVQIGPWTRADPDRPGAPAAAVWNYKRTSRIERSLTAMSLIALVLIAIVAIIVFSFALHVLFSPWLLLIVGVLLAIKFLPRRSHR
jgi:hypothetical protein